MFGAAHRKTASASSRFSVGRPIGTIIVGYTLLFAVMPHVTGSTYLAAGWKSCAVACCAALLSVARPHNQADCWPAYKHQSCITCQLHSSKGSHCQHSVLRLQRHARLCLLVAGRTLRQLTKPGSGQGTTSKKESTSYNIKRARQQEPSPPSHTHTQIHTHPALAAIPVWQNKLSKTQRRKVGT